MNHDEILEQAKKHYELVQEAWQKQYKYSEEDMTFCTPDCQWPEDVKQARAGKPTYASDRVNSQVKSLVNAQRENRPAIQIHPTNDSANEDVAEVLQGIIRHIEYDSDADLAYDQAFEDTVRVGLGFMRVLTEYEKDSFDQTIKIESLNNPFQVYIDPGFKKLDGSDINFAFIIDVITQEEFKNTYPDADLANASNSVWMSNNQRMPQWFSNSGKECVVAEYFIKEEEEITLCKMTDGRVVEKSELRPEERADIVIEREDKKPVIHWYKLCGTEILQETVWPGERIPVIPVFGDVVLEKGERIWSGLVRKIKEEQVMLNVAKTSAIELVAASPKVPYIGPVGFVGNRKDQWANAGTGDDAYLEFEIVDDQGNPMPPPQRNVQEPPIQGTLELIQLIENDIKSTNNMYDPTLGQKVANQSGVAVKALQNAGSTTNYHFSDNLSRAIRLLGRMLLELIPKVYNEKRVIRIVGLDDKHKLVTINGIGHPSETGCATKNGVTEVFDVTTGRYDVTVSSGPSYQTKRQENLSMLFDLASKDPQLMAVAGDLIVSQLDSPIAIQLTKRLEKALPPGLLDGDNDTEIPAVIQQRLQQDQQMIQQLTQTLQKETQLADKVAAEMQVKLQIAQMDQQTELMKVQANLQHETNVLQFKEELNEMRMKTQASADVLKDLHRHILAKDEMETKAALESQNDVVKGVVDAHVGAHVKSVGQPIPPAPTPLATLTPGSTPNKIAPPH